MASKLHFLPPKVTIQGYEKTRHINTTFQLLWFCPMKKILTLMCYYPCQWSFVRNLNKFFDKNVGALSIRQMTLRQSQVSQC
jgi:hypothetical protein